MRISTLIATGTSVAAAAAVGSLASRPAVQSSWYARLRKPRYQPPEIVFPVVWPMLYADMVGLYNVLRSIERYAAQRSGDAAFWQPAALLARLAAEDKTFNAAAA